MQHRVESTLIIGITDQKSTEKFMFLQGYMLKCDGRKQLVFLETNFNTNTEKQGND